MQGNPKLISIHALLAESDRVPPMSLLCPSPFLSTLSLRRATEVFFQAFIWDTYFYPRSPCGERRQPDTRCFQFIHISIHALLAESDGGGHISKTRGKNFYPRSPCGERLSNVINNVINGVFLSTLSLRRATAVIRRAVWAYYISIHALLAESDFGRAFWPGLSL